MTATYQNQAAGPKLGEILRKYAPWLLILLIGLGFTYWKIVKGMAMDWYLDDNYSHGFIVPVVAGYFLYTRWGELKETRVNTSLFGLIIVIFGLFQLLLGYLALEYFTMRSSLIVVLAGLSLALFGYPVLRKSSLPLLYLLFMVPIPYIVYDAVAFPLKLFISDISVLILKAVGVVVMQEGNIIIFPNVTLEVADACSGIRSLISLAAIGVAFAFLTKFPGWKKLVLVLTTLPIAIITNMGRVVGTGLMATYWTPEAALGFFHEFTGIFVYVAALLMLLGAAGILRRI